MSATESARSVPRESLETFTRDVLEKVGLRVEDAAVVAECLVCANLSGFDSHGVVRLAHYVHRLSNGTINPRPRLVFERKAAAVGILDGDNGLGHVVMHEACAHAKTLAREAGTATISIRSSSHFGMTGYHVMDLVREGLAAMLTTATDKYLVPHGSRKPFFGTNPLALGFPTPGIPLVLDMATTSIPFGKLALAAKEGRSVPAEWGVDEEGRPSTDPTKIRGLHPIAGPKGSGLAMVVDVFSSLLSGMAFGPHIVSMYGELDKPRGLGHFLAAWDIERFVPLETFTRRMGELIDELHALPAAEGHERVLYPGEKEGLTRRRRIVEGIPIEPGLERELRMLGQRYGVVLGGVNDS